MLAEPDIDAKAEEMDEKWYAWCLSEWQGMPECINKDLRPWKRLQVQFASPADMRAFADLVGVSLTEQTKSIWYPPEEDLEVVGRVRYISEEERP